MSAGPIARGIAVAIGMAFVVVATTAIAVRLYMMIF